MIVKSIIQGFIDVFQRKKLIFIFWSLNVLISLLFLFPYLSKFNRFFSHRVASQILEKANEYTYLMEFFRYSSGSLASTGRLLLLGKLIVMVFSLLLSGGIISIFLEKRPLTTRDLLTESGRFLVRIILLSLVHLIILFSLVTFSIIIYLPVSLLLPPTFVENTYFYFFLGWVVMAFLFILLAFLLFDLSRIQLVYQDQSSVLRAYLMAVVDFIQQPFTIYLVYLILAVLWTLMIFLYWKFQSFLSDTSTFGLILEFIFLQLFVWFQYGIRLSRYGALIRVSEINRKNL